MRKAAFICLEPIISMPQSLVVDCFFLAAACGETGWKPISQSREFGASIATQLTASG